MRRGRDEAGASRLAYVIYTSGSSGEPKGVMVEERSLLALLQALDHVIPGPRPGTWLACTELGFDISVVELIWTLSRGFTVVLAEFPGTLTTSPPADGAAALEAAVARHGATHLQCTPTRARVLLADPAGRRLLGRIPHLLLGGEALAPALARELLRLNQGTLTNLYGPTEATVWCTSQRVTPDASEVPIGTALAHARTYVLDAEGRRVPPGVSGELYVGGECVARGYVESHDPGGFMADPFAPEPGARMFRTGDLVQELPGRGLIFLGRLDRQLKLRGYRIEPAEIEHALRQHANVRECAVGLGPEPSAASLSAYVVARAGALRPDELRRHLTHILPDYMIPARFVQCAELPISANGKLDRTRLSVAPRDAALPHAATPVARTPTEARLMQLWAPIVGRAELGLDDGFHEAGGDSLMLSVLQEKVLDEWQLHCTLVEVLECASVRGLAGLIDARRVSSGARAHGGAW
jgi:amino acid adenylation domain-containing protein